MTQRQVAKLACRVLALWAVVDALKSAQHPLHGTVQAIEALSRGYTISSWAVVVSFVPLLAQLLLAVWLWKRAGLVAVWMTGETLYDEPDEPEVAHTRVTADQVQQIVLSSLGVWVLVSVVPEIAATIFEFLLAYLTGGGTPGAFTRAAFVIDSQFWLWCFQLLLGLWLSFGAFGITRLLRRASREPPIASGG